jgi:opacity protein-like surface antigen
MSRLFPRLSVSAAALILSAGLAGAADIPAAPSPVYSAVPASNWAGFYAGSLVSYGWADFDVGGGSANVSGTSGGPLIGYNWQSGSFVYGLEGDLTLHEIRGSVDDSPIPTEADTLYSAHVRGRVGYDLGWALPYIAGGFAANESYVRDAATGFDGDNQHLFGWTVGAGVDVDIGETFVGPITLRVEYLYEDLSSELFAVGGGMDVSQSSHFIRGAIISKIGGRVPSQYDGTAVDWSGPYAGLMVGFGSMNVSTSGAGADDEFDTDGPAGGIYSGRNWQWGNVVAGFDGSLLLTDFEGSGSQPGGFDVDFRNNIQGDARLRLGYAVGEFLPFIAGGVSWTRSEQEATNVPDTQRGRVPAKLWNVGAGVDYRLSENFSLRGEYMYVQSFDAKSPEFGGIATDQELDAHEVRFGAAYHFN